MNKAASLHEFPLGVDILDQEYRYQEVKDAFEKALDPSKQKFYNPMVPGSGFWDWKNKRHVSF